MSDGDWVLICWILVFAAYFIGAWRGRRGERRRIRKRLGDTGEVSVDELRIVSPAMRARIERNRREAE